VTWTDEYWAIGGGSVPFAYKWKSANSWASINRQYLLRLADIILLKAEALNELGRTGEAAVELNAIRRPAHRPARELQYDKRKGAAAHPAAGTGPQPAAGPEPGI